MTSKDLTGQDDRAGGRFRMNSNRKIELSLQEELDAVCRQSLFDLGQQKEASQQFSPTPSEATKRCVSACLCC